MVVTLPGMVMEVRAEQPMNALFPMMVTLFGMVTEVMELVPRNAKLPMAAVGYPPSVEGIVTTPPVPVYSVMVATKGLPLVV
jgi:hypothetical protein